jgi:rhamnosyltransferase
MQVANEIDLSAVATITVTYNPDPEPLRLQLDSLPAESQKIVVDNASQAPALQHIEALVAATPNTRLLRNVSNLGLAAAVNRGARIAREQIPHARFLLLLDQDSEPQPGSVLALVQGFAELERQGERVGCVGPLLSDSDTGLSHGFHQAVGWRWRRAYPAPGSVKPVRCASLNGSGTLVPIEIFLQLGGLDEALNIDHVDTEWSFRALAAGFGLRGIPAAVFKHRMGQSSVRYWLLGWRVWPSRSPQRHFYLFRNAAVLMRRPYVPRVWKFWAVVKLFITAVMHGVFDPERRAQWHQMNQGLREGLRVASTRPSGRLQ